jgi:hypothetical protein
MAARVVLAESLENDAQDGGIRRWGKHEDIALFAKGILLEVTGCLTIPLSSDSSVDDGEGNFFSVAFEDFPGASD